MGFFGLFNKEKKQTLDKGLEKTKQSMFDKIARAVAGKSKVDDDVLDDLEEVLITSDVGVDTTLKIIQSTSSSESSSVWHVISMSLQKNSMAYYVMKLLLSLQKIIQMTLMIGIFLPIINLM